MNKFEKLIEYIINDEDQKARELFHDIVVEKSRDIYESIMDEENMDEQVAGDQVGDMVDQVSKEEAVGEDDESGEEYELGGDEGEDEFSGEEEVGGEEEFGRGEEEDQIMNIDAKLDELLAKFDEIMGGEEQPEEMPAEEPAMDMEPEMGHEEPAMDEMYEATGSAKSGKSGNPFAKGSAQSGKSGSAKSGVSGKSGSAKSGKSGTEMMREYVDRIGDIYGGQGDASEGDAVGSTGKKTAVNTKAGSVGPGNNFGGTPVKATGPTSNQDGTSPTKASNEYNKGQSEIKSGNRNVPGGKADSLNKTGTEYSKENGAEGQTTDGKVSVATKSVQAQNTGKK